jgi:hypothetical protein
VLAVSLIEDAVRAEADDLAAIRDARTMKAQLRARDEELAELRRMLDFTTAIDPGTPPQGGAGDRLRHPHRLPL